MADAPPLFFERRLGGLFPACPAAELSMWLRYHSATGLFTWKRRPLGPKQWNTRYADQPALTAKTPVGYLTGLLFGKHVKAHAVAWAMMYGRWPTEIDHINGDKADNRIANLREVTRQENSKNRSLRSDNSTGVVGISHRHGKWLARIQAADRNICLGTFATIDEAIEARRLAELDHGYHENHGRTA